MSQVLWFRRPRLDTSFALPQDDVDHPTDDGERESHPGQDVREAKGDIVRGQMPVCMSHCEDGGTTHHAQACKGEKTENVSTDGEASRPPGTSTHYYVDGGSGQEGPLLKHSFTACLPVIRAGSTLNLTTISCKPMSTRTGGCWKLRI